METPEHGFGACERRWSGTGLRLTSGGRDVDVDADLGDPAASQRRHAGVRAEVCELEVDDVQIGGSGRDVGVGLGDDHPFGAA